MKQWESHCDGIAGSGRGLKLMRSFIEWFKFSNVCNISHLKNNPLFPLCGLMASESDQRAILCGSHQGLAQQKHYFRASMCVRGR